VFAAWRKGVITLRPLELVLPALLSLLTVFVIYYTVKDSSGFSPAYVGVIWVATGTGISLVAKSLTRRIGSSLARELDPVGERTAAVPAQAQDGIPT
jgi:hypothetical protein